ncbi:MAG: nuclear transport factor 2 family protein [Caulobacteraceae bacterium]
MMSSSGLKPLFLALTLAVATPGVGLAASAAEVKAEANTKLVLAMWKGVIDEASEAAVMRYIAPDYIQHNTKLPNGRAGLLEGVRRLKHPVPGQPPHPKKTLIHAVAQGDLVVLTWVGQADDPDHPGKTRMVNRFDMFRVADGLVREHWDDASGAR